MNLDQIRADVARARATYPTPGGWRASRKYDIAETVKTLADHCEELMQEIEVRDRALKLAEYKCNCQCYSCAPCSLTKDKLIAQARREMEENKIDDTSFSQLCSRVTHTTTYIRDRD